MQFEAALRKTPSPEAALAARLRVTQIGLRIYSGQGAGTTQSTYERLIEDETSDSMKAVLRQRMGRWLYRAGNAEGAVKELEAARQLAPQNYSIDLDLAWAQTDAGRQADAFQALDRALRGDPSLGDAPAVQAVLLWRTDRHGEAASAFQRCAEMDPVWLQPRWAAQNYTPAAAAILNELRNAEIARRKEEEKKRAQQESAGRH